MDTDLLPLLAKIAEKIKKTPDLRAAEDLLALCREVQKTDRAAAARYLLLLSDLCERWILSPSLRGGDVRAVYDLHRRVCALGAPDLFHLFLLLAEWDREPKARFYPPRRAVLRRVVDAMQRLADGHIDLLTVSLPPGVGKSTLAIFFLCWLAGKYPDDPILMGSHSSAFVKGVYEECLRILDPRGEYRFQEAFPGVSVSSTNAKDLRIDLGRRKRFETLEFTSVGSGNAGLYRAKTLLYCDDLIPGVEVALSKERLDKLWETYTTDLRQRKMTGCRELHIATRWSLYDVIGRLEKEYGGNARAEFLAIPALDEKDESNFAYPGDGGFSTAFYHEQREMMDAAFFRALYMNEPVEREGILYHPDELRRFYKEPEGTPDAILAVCDTKDRGKDYFVMPVAYLFGEDLYIMDAVCDDGLPERVEPRLVRLLLSHGVHTARFEGNAAGGAIARSVQEKLEKAGGRTVITTKFNTANKETRILVSSAFVKAHCLFRDRAGASPEYRRMLDMLCAWSMKGKNPHDDVPDALAMLADLASSLGRGSEARAFNRPF